MPLIVPPTNYSYDEEQEVKPKKKLVYIPAFGLTPYEDYRRVALFLNVPEWKCECGLVNFGRNLLCVGRHKKPSCNRLRPSDWKPYPWEYSL